MAEKYTVKLSTTYTPGDGGEAVTVESTGAADKLQEAVREAKIEAKAKLVEEGVVVAHGSGGGGSR